MVLSTYRMAIPAETLTPSPRYPAHVGCYGVMVLSVGDLRLESEIPLEGFNGFASMMNSPRN